MNTPAAMQYAIETARCMFEDCNHDDNREHSTAVCGGAGNREPHHVPGSENGNDELPPLRHVDAWRRCTTEKDMGC